MARFEVCVVVTRIVIFDSNDGWCSNPTAVGRLFVGEVSEQPALNQVVQVGRMVENAGVHGFGHVSVEGTVVAINQLAD